MLLAPGATEGATFGAKKPDGYVMDKSVPEGTIVVREKVRVTETANFPAMRSEEATSNDRDAMRDDSSPLVQLSTEVAPTMLDSVPLGHRMQVVEPTFGLKVPAGQRFFTGDPELGQ
jgi:hypothetical protein